MSTSLFEIVGPIMVGPSSSHTAGMARIGMMAHRIAAFEPASILLRLSPTLRTTYHGHRTDASLIGGALGMNENSTGLRSALEYAAEHDVSVNIEFYPPNIYHPNTAQLEMVSRDGEKIFVRGISVGGGSMYIDAIDEQPIHLEPDQVIDALIDVEQRLPGELRATTIGGLACTNKAVCLRRQLAKELVNQE